MLGNLNWIISQRFYGKILFDVGNIPVRKNLEIGNDSDWNQFYPDATEDMPFDQPKSKTETITITCFVDADHARDKVTRKSVTGIVVLLETIPMDWTSKCQKTVKSSTYSSEMID